MNRNERRALVAQLARRLDERPDVPILQHLFSLMRQRPKSGVHPCYVSDEELHMILNPVDLGEPDAIG